MSVPFGLQQARPSGKFDLGWIVESWAWWREAAGVYIGATFVISVITFVGGWVIGYGAGLLSDALKPRDMPSAVGEVAYFLASQFLVQVLVAPLSGWATACVTSLALRQVRGESIVFRELFAGGKYWIPMTLITLLFMLLAGVGLLLFLVGALFTSCLPLPAYAMIVDGIPIGEAWSTSLAATKRDWLNGGVLSLVLFLLTLGGYATCGLGLLAVIPMFGLVSALAYRDMIGWPAQIIPDAFVTQPGVWPPAPTQPNSDDADDGVAT